jgi:hypothetical protein
MTVDPIIALVWVAIQRRPTGDKGIGSRIRSRASSFARVACLG